MQRTRPALFRGRHFEDHVIVLCFLRWYLRYCLTLRDLEEMMSERGLAVDHSTIGRWVLRIWRWVQRYAPELNKRVRRELKPTNGSWRVDETYIRVKGRWTYLYRAVGPVFLASIDTRMWGGPGLSNGAVARAVQRAGQSCGLDEQDFSRGA
jgi:IS6 family transposase